MMARDVPPEPAGSAVPAGAAVPASRVALVTGATRGIGRALASGLLASGVAVAALGRDRDRVDAAVRALRSERPGERVVGVVADVTRAEEVDAALDEARAALGGIDLVVNNAGRIDAEVPLWEADPDEWWSVVETNLRGPFTVLRAVVPGMLAQGGGRVVDLASGASSHEMRGSSAYNASKTALTRLGANLHGSGFARGLRTFEVSPGSVRTDMTLTMPLHAGRTDWTPVDAVVEMVREIASGRLDAWSGAFLRVTHDTPAALRAAADAGAAGPHVRRLRVTRWGPDDPMPADLPGSARVR
ncbi:SDR family oxidoreductase [Cellulomonas sp. PhB143]|uniref:SDR family oxidoreductase n=1 Tax=Cellulomonas sp. PhB143 TaxID=2485186 RepID=UPI000FBA937D|nr:SDR family oxidoreductase [Cellulomonas sp. PhB143]ROS77250.1 NADP-dependent 3-hydroxy acid dehydrogenase YdfG [Cellulomonas sp. PhB143]